MTRVPSLYVFSLSHYCEKAVWACDYKRMPYRSITLLPGPHLLTIRRIAQSSRVPVLIHEGRVIQDSGAIIDYLDTTYPDAPLTPKEPGAMHEARHWETELDRELGEPARSLFYYHALGARHFLVKEYNRGGPRWGPWFYALAFPVIARAVRRRYCISRANAERSLARLQALFKRLDGQLRDRPYLAGDSFSRADLTLAALAAPLVRPLGHPLEWAPESAYPRGWIEETRSLRDSLTAERVRELYRVARNASSAAQGTPQFTT